jgi:signal transduction histidine kinase
MRSFTVRDSHDFRHLEFYSVGSQPVTGPDVPNNSDTPGEWLIQWGPPSDVLEFTRAEIFDEILKRRDDERQRVGQELHDSAGQLLVALQLSVARLRGIEHDSSGLLDEICDTADQIQREIRSLAFINYPVALGPCGVRSALQALVHGFGKRTGSRATFETIGDDILNKGVAMALLRVGQEALVNVHRHAHATSINVKLVRTDDAVELTITDNGVGIPPAVEYAEDGGVGIPGMRLRIERLGGQFHVRRLKRGTKISARVPAGAFC